MRTKFDVLRVLADGQFRSGESIGAAFGVSRTAVWKNLQQLKSLGLRIDAVPGKGYRIEPLEFLDAKRITECLEASSRRLLTSLEIHDEIDSTNRWLLDAAARGAPSASACLAERQTTGRGRRGRTWLSPFGRNIYLSLLWRFTEGPSRLVGLSLAVALAVTRTLAEAGVEDAQVKWPNDVWCKQRKLAGVLLEVAGESTGPCHVVIGIGINHRMPSEVAETIDQPWADVEQLAPGISRNRLAGGIIHHLLLILEAYVAHGFEHFRAEWSERDAMYGREVALEMGGDVIRGTACGIDGSGALLLQGSDGRVRAFQSGEVSLRTIEESSG